MIHPLLAHLESVMLTAVYQPPTGSPIHTYHLTFRHPERTLTNVETNEAVAAIRAEAERGPAMRQYLLTRAGGHPN